MESWRVTFVCMLTTGWVYAKEENKGWILNSPEFHCDSQCKSNLYAPSTSVDTTDCEQANILTMDATKAFHLSLCTRRKNGSLVLTTTKIPRKDYRISCRPSDDRMGWYRGWQSLTFNGFPCIRWDEAPVKFPLHSFYNVSAPSVDYTTLKVFSTTLTQHENYCRNPDNHPHGPWCFYNQDTGRGRPPVMKRAPCFHTCITDIKKLCLAKAFFPYYQTPYWSEGAPRSPVDPRRLREVSDQNLKAFNDRVDLTDILDVPAVIRAIGQATPLYSITLTTRHLAQARQAGNAVVVRKKCHQTGIRTLIAGPWTPVRDDSLKLYEDSFEDKKRVAEGFQDFLRAQFLAGRQGIDKPWKPCFTACEDNTFTCWPMQTAAAANQRLFYFGFKETTANQRLCLKWTEVQLNWAEALQVFYYDELFTVHGQPNRFMDGGGRLLHSPVCLDLARLIGRDKSLNAVKPGPYREYLMEVFKQMYWEGPGCFSWTDESQQYVEYAPCFRPCPCNTPSMTAPFKPYRDMCQSDNGDFEPCTARRVSRKIHIREHDDRLALPPRADLSGVTTPLMLIVAAGIGCLLLSSYEEVISFYRFVLRR
ncbi:hypothetical protein Q1695_015686 [Nippostrongylus brasiliensis]|nr:hypothetical protein Q1695_015686 [Nippostrongylus brasiliensis]